MYFYEMEKNVFYVMEGGYVVISNPLCIPEINLETEIIGVMSHKVNGKEITSEEDRKFGLMMEELRDEPTKYTVELYNGTLELLEKYFGYCLDVEKKDNKFYGYLNN